MSLKVWFVLKALKGELPLWMYKPIGKQLAKKIGLSEMEDKMPETPENAPNALETSKPFWKSKAKLSAIITVAVGAIQPISTAFGHPVEVPQWLIEVLIGLGVYGLRDAIKK